jgi:peroxiredoxin
MAPELVAVEHWINSEPLTLAKLRGKVVLVHFYAFQCHNCHANFDIYRRWHGQLRERGVVVLGIQTPETSRERDPQAVKAAARDRELQFPILVDLDSENWKAWGNTMWPTVYVVDKQGYLRHLWQGELNWNGATADKTIEQVVEQALAEH